MSQIDLTLLPLVIQMLPELLRDHPYGLCELAGECARRLHQPIYEVMTPLSAALTEMAAKGQVLYDRDHNQVALI